MTFLISETEGTDIMINIEDKSYQPSIPEISEYICNPLFDELYSYMNKQYNAICKVEYSGDNILLGWNVKFSKAGRTLCRIYPRKGHFPMLLIVGMKEKERVEELLPSLSEGFKNIYLNTKEGMGQRWMIFDFTEHDDIYDDVLKIIRIRRESK